MQIQISWRLQKPTDLDLHCLLKKSMSCSAREGLKLNKSMARIRGLVFIRVAVRVTCKMRLQLTSIDNLISVLIFSQISSC